VDRCDVNLQIQDGNVPLHMSASLGHEVVTKQFLIVESCYVDLQDQNRRTPLHYTTYKGHVSVIYDSSAARNCHISPSGQIPDVDRIIYKIKNRFVHSWGLGRLGNCM
jgi:ankyrin repeat protein